MAERECEVTLEEFVENGGNPTHPWLSAIKIEPDGSHIKYIEFAGKLSGELCPRETDADGGDVTIDATEGRIYQMHMAQFASHRSK